MKNWQADICLPTSAIYDETLVKAQNKFSSKNQISDYI